MKKYILKSKKYFLLTVSSSLLLALISSLWSVFMSRVTREALSSQSSMVLILFLFGLGLLLCLAVVQYYNKYMLAEFNRTYKKHLYSDVFRAIYSKDILAFRSQNSGDYLSVINTELPQIGRFYFQAIIDLIQHSITTVIAAVVLAWFDWRLLIVQLFLMLLPVLKAYLMGDRLAQSQSEAFDSNASYLSLVKDYFIAHDYLSTGRVLDRVLDQHWRTNDNQRARMESFANKGAVSMSLSMVFVYLNQVFFLLVAGYMVVSGELTMASMVGAMTISGFLNMPLIVMTNLWTQMKTIRPSVRKVEALLSGHEVAMKDKQHKLSDLDSLYPICLEDFSVRVEDKEILHQVNLKIEKGKKYALVGPSGSGKSTLLKSLMGFFTDEFTSGKLSYGGIDSNDINLEIVQLSMAYIEQKVFLLEGSLLENVTLFQEFPEAELRQVIKDVKGDRFIQDDVIVDDHIQELGSNLSGGEIQKIAIARALLQKKQILLCDEITANLDMRVANDVLNIILGKDDLTVLNISHQLSKSYLEAFDVILFIDNGRLKECGSFSELMSAEKSFYHYWSYHQKLTQASVTDQYESKDTHHEQ